MKIQENAGWVERSGTHHLRRWWVSVQIAGFASACLENKYLAKKFPGFSIISRIPENLWQSTYSIAFFRLRSLFWKKTILSARISTVCGGIVQLNKPQKFAQTDPPIMRIVIRAVGSAVLLTVFGGITVLSAEIAVIGFMIVKLDNTEQF